MSDMIGKLDEELMEKASGGVIFNAINIDGSDKNNPWEVLDDNNGQTLGRFSNRDDAIAAAGKLGKNHMEVNWDQVLQLRGQK